MSISHFDARKILEAIWLGVVARTPSTQELQAVQAVCALEGAYGNGWKGAMAGSNNWSAIQCNHPPDATGHCPPGCAPYDDTHADGTKYRACFRVYATPEMGAAGALEWFAHRRDVLDAACSCVMVDFARAMHEHHYFEGISTVEQVAVTHYAQGLLRNAQAICKTLGEECLFVLDGPKDWGDGDDAPAVATDGGGEKA